jgi:hypothetical protein
MGIATYISATTGQVIRLVVQTVDGYGQRADGYVPIVQSVIFPDLGVALGYPQEMTQIATGLYVHGLELPQGVDGLGTYIANIFLMENSQPKWEVVAINASRPFGISSVTPI